MSVRSSCIVTPESVGQRSHVNERVVMGMMGWSGSSGTTSTWPGPFTEPLRKKANVYLWERQRPRSQPTAVLGIWPETKRVAPPGSHKCGTVSESATQGQSGGRSVGRGYDQRTLAVSHRHRPAFVG